MSATIDLSTLPGPAQKILAPDGPAPLRAMAAKGVVPGLKPADALSVVVLLAEGTDAAADTARQTLANLPAPLVLGALAGDVQPGLLAALGPRVARNAALAEKVLTHPAVDAETVCAMATVADEAVTELIATNEERLLAHPAIIERLYMNESTRMSTADRILELAVRNKVELHGIPAFEQAAAAILDELVCEPTDEPTFDDIQFRTAEKLASEIELGEEGDTHKLNEETGEEEVVELAKPLQAVWSDLRPPAKIRLLQLGKMKVQDERGRTIGEVRFDAKAVRMLGVRDANPLVAVAAIKAPGIGDNEVVQISGMRNVCEDVLTAIANSRAWTRHYMVKYNLVANPRTPFAHASKFIVHLRENDLKTVAKSREVAGAVQTAARQQLQRKGK